MQEFSESERRIFRRIRFKEPVQFQFKDQIEAGGSVSSDLSEGGIRLMLFKFIPLNTELTLQVHLTSQKVLECHGRVVWIEKIQHAEAYQAGLEFRGTDSIFDSKREIQKFLSTISQN